MEKQKLDISMKSVNRKFSVFLKNIKEREREERTTFYCLKIAWSVNNTFDNIQSCDIDVNPPEQYALIGMTQSPERVKSGLMERIQNK